MFSRILFISGLLLTPPAFAQENGQPITVIGFDHEGLPLPGVKFDLVAGSMELSSTTGEAGEIEARTPDGTTSVTVSLADPRYQTFEPVQSSALPPYRFMFSLYTADPRRMSFQERLSFASNWPRFVAAEAAEAFSGDSATTPTTLSPVMAAAFLEGTRREGEPLDLGDEIVSEDFTVSGRLVDSLGNPRFGVSVHLFLFDPATGEIRMAGHERTNPEGLVLFSGVSPGSWYRLEAEADIGTGRSSILRHPSREIPRLVLREEATTIRGIVFDGQKPAAGTLVRVRGGQPGAPALTTTTDSSGFFELAPMPVAEVVVEFVRSTQNGPRIASARLSPGPEEYMIPFHLVSAAAE